MVTRTKALAITSWVFLSAMETFVNPRAHTTAEVHFTVKSVVLKLQFYLVDGLKKLATYIRALIEVISIANL
jgi:hypothetical protein